MLVVYITRWFSGGNSRKANELFPVVAPEHDASRAFSSYTGFGIGERWLGCVDAGAL